MSGIVRGTILRWPATRAAAVLLVAVALVGCSSNAPLGDTGRGAREPAPGAAPLKLTMSYSNLTPDQWPVFLAEDLGLFTKHGLDLDLRQIDSSTGVAALIAGETQAAAIGGSEVMAAATEGADLAIIAGLTKTFSFRFMAPKEVQRVEDLRGKRVGVSRFGSSSDIATRLALQRLNLVANRDVEIVQVGSLSARIQALESGAIQGGVAQPPDTARLAKTGNHVLFDVSDLNLPAATSTIAAKRGDLSGRRPALQAMIDAMTESLAVHRSDPEAAKAVLGRWLNQEDPEALQEAWEFYTQKIFPRVPRLDVAQLEAAREIMAEENPRIASYDVTKLIDNSLVESAETRGVGAR
jgi:NitT/TauT family transport system substrate-binding protein